MNKLHLIVDTNVRPPTLHKKNNAPAPKQVKPVFRLCVEKSEKVS